MINGNNIYSKFHPSTGWYFPPKSIRAKNKNQKTKQKTPKKKKNFFKLISNSLQVAKN